MNLLQVLEQSKHPAAPRLRAITRDYIDLAAAYQRLTLDGNAAGVREVLPRLIAVNDEGLSLLRPLLEELSPANRAQLLPWIHATEMETFSMRLELDREKAVTWCDAALADHVCPTCGRGWRCPFPTSCSAQQGPHPNPSRCPTCLSNEMRSSTSPTGGAAGGRLGRFL